MTLSAVMSTAWRLSASAPHSRQRSRPATTTFWPLVTFLAIHSPRPPQIVTSKYDVRSVQSPLASLTRSLWAMRMLQTGWVPVGVRSSGSRVRLPEIVTWLMSNPLMLVLLLLVG